MANETRKNEIRFYCLLSLIILSLISGIIVLYTKSPVQTKKAATSSAFSFLTDSKVFIKKNGIVLLHVDGVIQFGAGRGLFPVDNYGVEYLVKRINQYSKEEKVKGMILRINSPGGTIGATQELYQAIMNFRSKGKYVVASMADIAASGGYYIAAACDKIYANPGTITGSIGVIIISPSFKGLFNKIGISYNVFKSGKHKDILSSHRDVSPAEIKILQSVVNDAYSQFYSDVQETRKIKDSRLKMYADGRIFTGKQAKRLKLIDEVGGLRQAIAAAGKAAGLGEDPEIIRDTFSPIQRILTGFSKKKSLTESILNINSDMNLNVLYLYQP